MKKYIVKTNSSGSESAFFGFMFHDAMIEYLSGDETCEIYSVTSKTDLSDALNDSEAVLEYSTVEQ